MPTSEYHPDLKMDQKMKRAFSILTIIIVFFTVGILSGCDDFDFSGCDCDEEIDDLIDDRGQPDDEEQTFEDGVYTLTYSYNDSGYSQTFRRGGCTDLCCETNFSTTDNQAPVAQDQSVFTEVNTPVDITLTATDIDGDSLTYQVLTPPLRGTLLGTAPDLTYTPNTNYIGDDSFTFKANDGRMDSLPATVEITVSSATDDGEESLDEESILEN